MSAENEVSNEAFVAEVRRISDEDWKLKAASNLYTGVKNIYDDPWALHLLYERPSGDLIYVMVCDVPSTLSGDILRLKANLPWESLSGHSAIRGDEISPIPLRHFDDDNYPDDGTIDLAQLPLVAFDERIHFAKASKRRSEIPNLLKAKGLPHIVELLGRTDDGKIVFPQLNIGQYLAATTRDIVAVKRILLQLAEALISLHFLGIIHRDLHLRNILGSSDSRTAYLCDLESYMGSAECPEITDAIARHLDLSAFPYSEKSDVYMFGRLMTDLILSNIVWTRWQGIPGGNWLPPAPFRSIVLACLAVKPSARPTMRQVKTMLEAISVPDATK